MGCGEGGDKYHNTIIEFHKTGFCADWFQEPLATLKKSCKGNNCEGVLASKSQDVGLAQ